jgi:hypothetical protein
MPELYFIAYGLAAGVLLDWLCRPKVLRRAVYVIFMVVGITACSQLGERQVLQLDGGLWGMLFMLVGQRLLFKRSLYFRDDSD